MRFHDDFEGPDLRNGLPTRSREEGDVRPHPASAVSQADGDGGPAPARVRPRGSYGELNYREEDSPRGDADAPETGRGEPGEVTSDRPLSDRPAKRRARRAPTRKRKPAR